jgi:hypothetical protein
VAFPLRRALAHLALILGGTLAGVALAEAAARLVGYRYSLITFLPPDARGDARSLHMALAPAGDAKTPMSTFDPDLLWRPSSAAFPELDDRGFRGSRGLTSGHPGIRVVLAVGDSNTLGPLNTPDHWPGYLQDVLELNRGAQPFRVVNAGGYGYTALQGLRRFREGLGLFRPEIVYFSFGANEGSHVLTPDGDYLAKAALLRGPWGRLRLAPPVLDIFWPARRRATPVPRVSTDEYRRALESFVSEARAAGAKPILLTRPFLGESREPGHWKTHAPEYNAITLAVARATATDVVDVYRAFHDRPDAFSDDYHFNRLGSRDVAQLLFDRLRPSVAVESDRRWDREIDFAVARERRAELGIGWWRPEAWNNAPGCWTSAEATATLQRQGGEDRLTIDADSFHPSGRTTGRIEAGFASAPFALPNGRHRWALALPPGASAVVHVRLAVDDPFVPRADAPGSTDSRTLGLFVHALRLGTAAPR